MPTRLRERIVNVLLGLAARRGRGKGSVNFVGVVDKAVPIVRVWGGIQIRAQFWAPRWQLQVE